MRTASVVKRGMGKGAGLSFAQREVLAVLEEAPEHVNPAIKLSVELMAAEISGDKEAFTRALRSGELVRAVEEGEREGRAVERILRACYAVGPVPSEEVPVGF